MKEVPEVLRDWDDRALNSRINNKADRPFLEREEIIATVLDEMKQTQTKNLDKPRAVVLWSPRGTGKTSLVRQLAKREEYAQSYKCGRLLIIDANMLERYKDRDPGKLLRSMIIWHLLGLFDGYRVGEVAFQALDFDTVIGLQSDPGVKDELKLWARSMNTADKAFQQWKAMTQTALNAPEGCPLLIFMDQTELLVNRQSGERSSKGGGVSAFTDLCSRLPQNMACFFVRTLDLMDQAPSQEYTRLIVHQVPALVPLSLEAAKKMMQGWQGKQYEDDVFEQMHLFASGVPRLLQWAFEAGGDLSTTQINVSLYMGVVWKRAWQRCGDCPTHSGCCCL